jgi:hypothetical protein
MSTGNANTAARRDDSPGRTLAWVVGGVIALILILMYVAFSGRRDELSTQYGKRRGAGAGDSVNGTAVLSAMFEDAKHRVTSRQEMNSRLDEYDTIVWFPDEFTPPADDARQFAEDWLASEPGRTFVYVGRDYDAAPEYWTRMLTQVEDSRWMEYRRRLAHVESEFATRRTAMPKHKNAGWFVVDSSMPARKIPDLDGPWAEGIDASKTDIVLAGRLDIPEANAAFVSAPWSGPEDVELEILLQSENDILAYRLRQSQWSGQIIVVANSSFLLNMPLVNHEHRKLAGKLIDECGPPGRVAFLESGPNGITVREGGGANERVNALAMFTVWPVSFIFLHFAALGIVYCIAAFPIFGRPHRLPSEARSDFGQHVAAFGELLARTKDAFFAQAKIQSYQTYARRGSGQAHRVKGIASVRPPASGPRGETELSQPAPPSNEGGSPPATPAS